MFAFLAYDGVPWNNNNAEHAIKSFAKYRRFSNGIGTERTIREYLMLLSICLTCQYRGIDFLKVLRGDAKGDYGFGPKGVIPLQLRPRRLGEGESALRTGAHQSGGTLRNKEDGRPGGVGLNKVLPAMLEKLGRSLRGFRFRVELAPDLWPVRIDSTKLEAILRIIVNNFRKKVRLRTAILSARNLRLGNPQPPVGLKGRYVISFSNGGRRAEPVGYAQGDEELGDLEADVYLDQVDALAKEFGGAATVRSAPTGRNGAKTIVTIYIPQYSSKLDPGPIPSPPGCLRPIIRQRVIITRGNDCAARRLGDLTGSSPGRLLATPRTAGIVKGFRMPARHGRGRMRGGRRPKSLEGGNRGGVCASGGVSLWGFNANVWV